MTAPSPPPERSPATPFRWLLGVQIGLAALLVLLDFAPALPRLLSPVSAPELDQPTRPGDQTRHYRPDRPAQPGPGIDRDMPRRLLVEEVVDADSPTVLLRGAIAPNDATRVMAELSRLTPEVVQLDSPGGSVTDALDIGQAIRDAGWQTQLGEGAVCLSACPYIFAGGTRRIVADSARLGVHQHSFGESTILPAFLAVEDIQAGQARVLAHLDDMGIDLRIMGPAMATPADEIYILTAEELADWNVVTP